MPEATPTCRIQEKYDEIKCQNPARPGDPDGFCILHSNEKEKDQKLFDKVIMEKLKTQDYIFSLVFFPGPVLLEEFEFKKDADFSAATFYNGAYFDGAIFSGKTDFSGATFFGEAGFSSVEFCGEADFSNTKFLGKDYFSWAIFYKKADFQGVSFNGDSYFYGSTFLDEVYFFNSIFSSRTTFRSLNPKKKGKNMDFKGDFSELELQEKAVILFQDTSLSQVRFLGTDLRTIEFYHVQ